MNINELNKVLSDEIYKLRAGKVKTERVNAVTRACAQIISGGRLQLSYIKMAGLPQGTIPFFGENGKAKRVIESPKKAKKAA